MTDEFHKPNVVVPLVPAYDTRFIGANAQMLAGVDQRKINFYYQNVKNPLLQQTTAELTKRPGVDSVSAGGSNTQTAYLLTRVPGTSLLPMLGGSWLISLLGTDIRASNNAGTVTVIVTAANTEPCYADTTIISGTETSVVQVRNTTTKVQRVFYSSSIGTWTEITDVDFTGFVLRGKLEHMDGWCFGMDSLNRIQNSDLNSLANWTAGQFITKQIKQDNPAGLARLGRQLLAFGDNTVEVFVNNGNPFGSPLISVPDRAQRVGLAGLSGNGTYAVTGMTHYYATLKNRIYFIGRFAGSSEQAVISYDGQNFEKVSTPAIDRALITASAYAVNTVPVLGEVAIAIQMTSPGTTSSHRWFMFFPEHNEWFEWTSAMFSSVNYEGAHCGILTTSNLYFMQSNNDWTDDDVAFTATVQFKIPKRGNNRDTMNWFGVDADTATASSALSVEFSDDDYQSFSAARTIDLNSTNKRLHRGGMYATRVVRLSHSANKECRLRSFLARVT